MHVGHIDVLYEVLITGCTALHSDSSPVLGFVLSEGSSLYVSEMRDGYDHIFVCVEVLRVEFLCRKRNLSPSVISIFFLHLKGLVLDDAKLLALACKHLLAIIDELHEIVIFVLKLFSFESCQLTESHFHDCSSLSLGECECLDKLVLRIIHRLGSTDDPDDLIYHIEGLEQTFEDMGLLLRLVKVEPRSAENHLMTMLHKIFDEVL